LTKMLTDKICDRDNCDLCELLNDILKDMEYEAKLYKVFCH